MKASRAVVATAFLVVACAPGERDFGESRSADGGGREASTARADGGDAPRADGDASVTESGEQASGSDTTESAPESTADASVGSTRAEPTTGGETATKQTSEGNTTGLESGSSAASTGTSVVDTSIVGTSGEPSYPTGETRGSEEPTDATNSGVSSSAVTSSPGPECQAATDCAPAPNYCHGVECNDGKCDYPHIREGEACGASGVCSEDRCTDGDCIPTAINEGLYCGESNAFCMVSGSCRTGTCETSSACSHHLSGTYSVSDYYGYSGGPAYVLGTNYEEMYVTGTLAQAANLTFWIHLPAYNSAATCGGTPDVVSAVIWVYVNGTRVASPGNWRQAEATWVASGPWTIPAGAFDVKLYAGEGDGCGWPADTPPIYVSDFEFGRASP